jgi:hypothetical protein
MCLLISNEEYTSAKWLSLTTTMKLYASTMKLYAYLSFSETKNRKSCKNQGGDLTLSETGYNIV